MIICMKFAGCFVITAAVLFVCLSVCGMEKCIVKIAVSGIASAVFAAVIAGDSFVLYYQRLLLGEILAILASASFMDRKERIIPNALPAMVAGIKLILSVCRLVSSILSWKQFGFDLLCGFVCILLLWLVSKISHNGIGMGDIKLLAALGFACGIEMLWTIILFALLICVMAVFVLLMMKKKTMNDSLPFAPFILAGYVGTLLLSVI